jgi:hypothetical protein
MPVATEKLRRHAGSLGVGGRQAAWDGCELASEAVGAAGLRPIAP